MTIDKGHGRRKHRSLKTTTALNEYLDWPGVAQIGQIDSVVEQDGKVSHETRYFITSVPLRSRTATPIARLGTGPLVHRESVPSRA